MENGLKYNLENRAEEVEKANKLLAILTERYGATFELHEKNVGSLTYDAVFPFPEDGVTVRREITLKDNETDSDVVLNYGNTWPPEKRGQGFGSKVLQYIIEWARELGFTEVRVRQVGPHAEHFIEKNGFKKCEEPNPTSDYVLRFDEDTKST